MTSASTAFDNPSNAAVLFDRTRDGSRGLWISAVAMTLLAAVCAGLQLVDARMVGDANTWHKPAKFFFSVAVHFATVSFGISLLPAAERGRKMLRTFTALLIFSGWAEMGYIVFRAARAEASHFNESTLAAQIAYPLMGVGALTMTAAAFYVGWRLWKYRRSNLMTEATAIGLMLGAMLGALAGGYMSAQNGHSVGGMPGTGVGFFGWSTSGGDLRIAHFIGLHAMQLVPLAAFSGRRGTVLGVAAFCIVASLAAFLQAVAGMPLLRG